MNTLIESFNKTKQAMTSEKITRAVAELNQYWDELELDHFEHVMDFTNYLSVYCEQLPCPETTYIVLAILFSHYLAIDKFLLRDDNSIVDSIHAKYLSLMSRHLEPEELEYYKYSFKTWAASCHEEAILKQTLPATNTPIARHSMWADWRWVNIGVAPFMRLVMMINFPNENLYSAITQSSIVYISMQCAYLNDVGSVVKDKGSNEVNYYLEVAPGMVGKQSDILEQSNKYLEMVDLSHNLKHVLRSAIHGSYLLYTLSERYFGRTESNW
ncbi:hypothetical protein BGZ80_001351 [Entomortierella chlamydospora]|uniref:Terpene synthase n=1 Tax=Entomortierella chlamydospora TaxID=101097 RepID=A0A9P6MR38_9FUNG|nr:hypothetical protein BGZ79_001261 [Entomortierella chlamydospora]KAG0010601.1 hypothetical protein BGZ80_001351 [Entomortierella chlamydospora]